MVDFVNLKSNTIYRQGDITSLCWDHRQQGFITREPNRLTLNPFRALPFIKQEPANNCTFFHYSFAELIPANTPQQLLLEIRNRPITWRFVPRFGAQGNDRPSQVSSVSEVYKQSFHYIRNALNVGDPYPVTAWLRSHMMNVNLHHDVQDITVLDLTLKEG